MSPGHSLDQLWHWMLLNTRVSSLVHEALGGVVEHASTDEDDLSDDAKMLQRLHAMNLMAAHGFVPDPSLWQSPGTITHTITCRQLYVTPHTSAEDVRQLWADRQAALPPKDRAQRKRGRAAEPLIFIMNVNGQVFEVPFAGAFGEKKCRATSCATSPLRPSEFRATTSALFSMARGWVGHGRWRAGASSRATRWTSSWSRRAAEAVPDHVCNWTAASFESSVTLNTLRSTNQLLGLADLCG